MFFSVLEASVASSSISYAWKTANKRLTEASVRIVSDGWSRDKFQVAMQLVVDSLVAVSA